MNDTASLILAAGYSSRMNAFKPLLNLGGITLIERVIQVIQNAGLTQIIVVSGYKADYLKPVLNCLGVDFTVNENFQKGMYSSVKTGVLKLNKNIGSFFLFPVDIPLIKSSTIVNLIEAKKNSNSGIIYPCYNKKRGHPPLISTSYISAILSNELEGGLRELLSIHQNDAMDVEVNDKGILLDMNTQQDYENLLKITYEK